MNSTLGEFEMPSIFDFDDGNGIYDVVTRQDYERWQEEKIQENLEKQKRDMISSDEKKQDISSIVPF